MSASVHPLYFETGASKGARVSAVVATFFTLALWLKYIVGRAPLGVPRIALALPAFVANTICPWFFNNDDEVLQRLCTVFVFSWLNNFKVLSYCWGREPLRESMTWPQMAAVMMLPVFPKPPARAKAGPEGRLQDSAGSGLSLVMRWAAKIVLLGGIVYIIVAHGDALPRVLRHYAFAFGLYAFVGFLMDGPAAVAVEGLGLQLVPTFDQPWMSSSLADFWGRRWNITTSSVLRTTVYDPVVDGSCVNPRRAVPNQQEQPEGQQPQQQQQQQRQGTKEEQSKQVQKPQQQSTQHTQHGPKPSMLRRQLGLQATFLVSGIVHEYIVWLVNDKPHWGWKWLVFFWMQAPLMSLEYYLGGAMRRAGLQLPRPLCILITVLLLEAMAYELFFGYVEVDTNVAQRVVAAVSEAYLDLLGQLRPLLHRLLVPAGWLER